MNGGSSKQIESAPGFSDSPPAEMSANSQHLGLSKTPERVSILDLEHVDDLHTIESVTNSSAPRHDSPNLTQNAGAGEVPAYATADEIAAQSNGPRDRERSAEPYTACAERAHSPEPMCTSPHILVHPICLPSPPMTLTEHEANNFRRNVMNETIGAWRIAKAASRPTTNLAWGEFRHRFALWIGFESNPIDCCWEYYRRIIDIAGTRRMFDRGLWMEGYARRMHHAKRGQPWTIDPNRNERRQFERRMIEDPEF
ncbi:hypothetical protein BDZ85DRAFT_280423 [Elsinoe ampelina]|uniref:Uncharacterized protein n=1 Tax=Elsinoe ampelina TaxID=302913 RepID=A0A6A6GHM1_9PEZI|nr:hypothetical protein BDZ85DRAFT_280423 [Elsinoe ampelina]